MQREEVVCEKIRTSEKKHTHTNVQGVQFFLAYKIELYFLVNGKKIINLQTKKKQKK